MTHYNLITQRTQEIDTQCWIHSLMDGEKKLSELQPSNKKFGLIRRKFSSKGLSLDEFFPPSISLSIKFCSKEFMELLFGCVSSIVYSQSQYRIHP